MFNYRVLFVHPEMVLPHVKGILERVGVLAKAFLELAQFEPLLSELLLWRQFRIVLEFEDVGLASTKSSIVYSYFPHIKFDEIDHPVVQVLPFFLFALLALHILELVIVGNCGRPVFTEVIHFI